MPRAHSIAIVGSNLSPDSAALCRGIAVTLRHVGLAHEIMTDDALSANALRHFAVALLPCGASPAATGVLQEFVRRGGKVLLGFDPPEALLVLLGLKRLKDRAVSVGEMIFAHRMLHGLPQRMFLSTRAVAGYKAAATVKPLARWHTLDDLTMQDPAAYLTQNGALLTTAVRAPGEHTQFSEDRHALGRFVAALLNHFAGRFDLLQFQRRLTGQLSDDEEFVRQEPPRDFEIRARWLPGVPTPNECAMIARQNFNLICPNLGAISARRYETETFHRPWLVADALVRCVDQAHRSGLEVFPCVTAWSLPTTELARFFDGTARLMKTGNRQSAIGNPNWMCPSQPDNQQLLIEAVTRLLDDFGLDGIVVGGLRFPDATACQCAGCRQRFEEHLTAKLGGRILNQSQRHSLWQQWRCEVLTDVLKRLLTACRATNPNARLAVATQPSWDRAKESGQDPSAWAQQHLADVFLPLDFTASTEAFHDELEHQMSITGNRGCVCAGLGVYAGGSEMACVAELVRQVRVVRELDADGFVVWHEDARLFEEHFADGLRAGPLRAPAKLPWHPNAPARHRQRLTSTVVKPPRRRIPPGMIEGLA